MRCRTSPAYLPNIRSAVLDLIKETKGKFTGDCAIKFLTNWKTTENSRGAASIDPVTRDIVHSIY